MLEKLGTRFTQLFSRVMPNAFVFALILSLLTGVTAWVWTKHSALEIIQGWYSGFFDLIGFAMQIVLLIITGYSIALSPLVKKAIDKLALYIQTPTKVYITVILLGLLLSMVSFGWIVITCVLARELAVRVRGIHYPFLIACVYFSFNSWVFGLSSSVPLLLNTEKNFLIEAGLLQQVIPTTYTLQSSLNIVMIFTMLLLGPLLFLVLRPRHSEGKELTDMLSGNAYAEATSIKEEAYAMEAPARAFSDKLNSSRILQLLIVMMGFTYIIHHFWNRGFDLNFNIMIFIFLIIGMLLHQTPMRYAISMNRSSSNISGILYQYPFYAGIMGIMLHTGMGGDLGQVFASVATLESYPFFAYLTGGIVNFAIPSAGGEFAVIGPSLITAITELGAGQPPEIVTAMISRASLSVAYGESLSNMLQPFFLLIVMPVMGKDVNLQARDVMGYLVIPFSLFFIIQALLVVYWPL